MPFESFAPEYKIFTGNLTTFGSSADGKRVKKAGFLLEGTIDGAAWSTIASGEYRILRKAGDVQSVPTDDNGDAVDWSSYMDWQDAGNQAFRASYTINNNGTLTVVTNESVTMYEIVIHHPGGGGAEDDGTVELHRETHLDNGDDAMIEINDSEPTSPYPGMLWAIPQ